MVPEPSFANGRGNSGGQAVGNFKTQDQSSDAEIHSQSHCYTENQLLGSPRIFFPHTEIQ